MKRRSKAELNKRFGQEYDRICDETERGSQIIVVLTKEHTEFEQCSSLLMQPFEDEKGNYSHEYDPIELSIREGFLIGIFQKIIK